MPDFSENRYQNSSIFMCTVYFSTSQLYGYVSLSARDLKRKPVFDLFFSRLLCAKFTMPFALFKLCLRLLDALCELFGYGKVPRVGKSPLFYPQKNLALRSSSFTLIIPAAAWLSRSFGDFSAAANFSQAI